MSGEPLGLFDLVLVHFDVCRHGDGKAANHEAGRHGPGLRRDILDWTDRYSGFLLNLPLDRRLHGLTWTEQNQD